MKRTRGLQLGIVLALSLSLAACGSSNNSNNSAAPADSTGDKPSDKKITLTVMSSTPAGEQGAVIEAIAREFEAENPSIKVDFSAPGADYENIMKVKMASNEMPDVFGTHGWAKVRYGEYLADLQGEEWASQLHDAIKPAVTDESGKVYVLPMDQDKSSLVYNKAVLEQYGIAVPQTWDEVMKAAEEIKTKSEGKVTAFHVGGADSWPLGQFFDYFATPAFISAEQNYAAQFLDGTFDWTQFDKLPQMLLDLQKNGYLNKDVLTAKYMDSAKAFAEGKAAFFAYGPYIIEEAKKTNPDVKGGLLPIPSIEPGDTPTFAGGEKTTWGVWKDSPNIEAAKKFVSFYAKPENVARVAGAMVLPAGLKGVDVNLGDLTEDFKTYENLRVIPFFDREYLPNGMWDVLCKNGQDLLAGGITVQEFSTNMKNEYERLRAADK
ncbi:Multiple sugar-binding protein precursor [compost metagenome]|uniref:Extracellular solute-binding protein n=1 Tax=Paenibacillus rhizolycopersici TaxID=2780073 RepID=A0ABS2H538_9BACL|nr:MULTISPECIES: extracellular solute-binding protein [Paenibacillus]MBM6995896.1 extracellular solute-binding protein [Paenibacillus rhizolycopersici]GIP49275.1 putative binding protein MsmE [Paenibacillus sp. J53TS2]